MLVLWSTSASRIRPRALVILIVMSVSTAGKLRDLWHGIPHRPLAQTVDQLQCMPMFLTVLATW